MNFRHPTHPGLWLNKPRLNTPNADGYDNIGDSWWRCRIHNKWYHGYCAGCHPNMDKAVRWGATLVAISIVIGLVGFVLWAAVQ